MKKIYLFVLVLGIGFNLFGQKKYQLGIYAEPLRNFSQLESSQMDYNSYVEIRNSNEPYRRGFISSILLERFVTEDLGLVSGIRLTSVSIGFNRQKVDGVLATNNPERENYSHQLDYLFLEIPLELKYKVFTYNFSNSNNKSLFKSFYTDIQTGIAISHQFQADHIRDYNLSNGEKEKTANEFESQLDRNQLNLATHARIGFNFNVKDKWTFSIQPGLNYYTLSTFKSGFKDNLFFYSTRFGVSYMF